MTRDREITRGQVRGDHGGGPRPGRGLDDFRATVFNYPTLAGRDRVAALDASHTLRF